jgi:hypothetical protein
MLFQKYLAGRFGQEYIVQIAVGGLLLAAGGFAWAANFIICPNCKLKLFWHALTKEGLGTWFAWLISEEKCPQCGSRDGTPPPNSKGGRPGKRR